MAARIRIHNWAVTPLGPIDGWPQSLRTLVDLMLAAPQLATLAVGSERIFLYNDEASRFYGERHPGVLGQPLTKAFPHEFEKVAPFYDRVFAGESIHVPAQPLDPAKTGLPEVFEAYLAPVTDGGGQVIAAYMTGFAIGDRQRAEQRQALLLRLSDVIRTTSDPAAIQQTAMRLLGEQLGLSRAYHFKVERENGSWVHVIESAYQREPDGPSVVGRHTLEHFGAEMFEGLARGEVIAAADVGALSNLTPEELARYHMLEVTAFINVPLLQNGEYRTGIGAHDTQPRAWTENEIDLIREVAARTWLAVERACAEAALHESETRLALAFKTLPIGIAIIDAAGDIVTANDEIRRFLPTGRIPSRDPDRSARWQGWNADGGIVRPKNFPGARALRGEEVSPGMQMRYRDDSGVEIWTEVLSAPLHDGAGRVNGGIVVVVDVDRAKRNEEAAKASEERLRQFGEASSDILWIRDAETLQWTYLTPAFEAIYGLSREKALTGDSYRNWQDLIVPEDRNQAIASISRVSAGERVTFEYRIRRPVDGETRWLRNTDFPMRDHTGRVIWIGGVGHDITELKAIQAAVAESEMRLRTLAEGIPQLVWRSGDKGLWSWCSPQWMTFTGQSQDESHSLGWLEAVHPDDRATAMHAWEEAGLHGRLDVEFRVQRASDGAWLWHRTRSLPVHAPKPDGAKRPTTEWLGTTTDIDDLKRLQGEQQVLVAELQHRTRNLLAVVRNIARRSIRSSPERDEYDARLAALGRVQGFLSRSLGHSVPLGDVVAAELQAVGDGVSDKVSIGGPAVELPGESVQVVALALHELATNAVKYGAIAQSSGRLLVRWRIEAGADGAQRLVIEWRESGVSMPDGPPTRRGYGSELITRALPYQLQAETSLEFTSDGVRCRIALPAGAFNNRTDQEFV